MKRAYVKPMMVGEEFVANEYCASTCGKTPGGDYIFKCDAPGGRMYYYPKNGGNAQYVGSYSPCGKTHIGADPEYYYDGFIDYDKDGKEDDGEARLIWIERGWFGSISNAHASASLSREMIDVVRS